MVLTVPINPLLDQVVHRLIESTERVVDRSGVEWRIIAPNQLQFNGQKRVGSKRQYLSIYLYISPSHPFIVKFDDNDNDDDHYHDHAHDNKPPVHTICTSCNVVRSIGCSFVHSFGINKRNIKE
mmetsp:Transcript_19984/g.22121  ORF Transcript_19984/g.22121 Transcript_19984/m.22121 type:complete len:124 (-) Transcript_19984:32-403(-)